jgi:hypothetical protein
VLGAEGNRLGVALVLVGGRRGWAEAGLLPHGHGGDCGRPHAMASATPLVHGSEANHVPAPARRPQEGHGSRSGGGFDLGLQAPHNRLQANPGRAQAHSSGPLLDEPPEIGREEVRDGRRAHRPVRRSVPGVSPKCFLKECASEAAEP